MSEPGYVEHYRANLAEARRDLAKISERMRNLERNGFVVWGKVVRRGMADYDGWLVKGGPEGAADKSFAEWVRCDSNVGHWSKLLAAELAAPTPGVERDDARLRRMFDRFKSGGAAAVMEPDRRLPVEREVGEDDE